MKKTKKCHIVVVVLFIAMNILPVSVYSEEINTDNSISSTETSSTETSSTETSSTETSSTEKFDDSKNLKINSNKDQSETNDYITDSIPTSGMDIHSGTYWLTLSGNHVQTNVSESGPFIITGLNPNADYTDETFIVPSRVYYGADHNRQVYLDKGFFDSFKEFIKNHPQIKKIQIGSGARLEWVEMPYYNKNLPNSVYGDPSYLNNMFSDLPQLTSVDLSKFNLANQAGRSADEMFANCTNLTEVKLNFTLTYSTRTFNKMFANCDKLTSIDLENINFSKAENANNMFYTQKPTPLVIYSDDNWLKNYFGSINQNGISRDNRSISGPMFLANGGKFNNGQNFKKYFNNIVISRKDISLSKFNSYKDNLEKEIKKNNSNFLNWKITSGKAPNTDNDLLQSTTYTAQWDSTLGNIPSEKDNIKQEVNSDLGIAYLPRAFSFPKTELSNNEDKQIIKISEDANYHVAVLSNKKNSWKLQAKLVWDTDDLKGNSYIQFSNPDGKINKNTNNGTSNFLNSDLKPVNTDNILGNYSPKITTDQFYWVMDMKVQNNNFTSDDSGIFDYDLGQLSLVLENPSKISEGKYTGNIAWDLSIVP